MSLLCNKQNQLSEKYPKPKSGTNPFSRKLKWFISSQTQKKSLKAVKLCWQLFQGVKRGCAAVPESFVQKSLADHRDALTDVVPEALPELTDRDKECMRYVFQKDTNVKIFEKRAELDLTGDDVIEPVQIDRISVSICTKQKKVIPI